MVACAWRRAAEEDPNGEDPDHLASNYEPCPRCRGAVGLECAACDGLGHVRRREGELDEEDLAACGDFLAAEAFVREHSLATWMAVHGAPDPLFLEAIACYAGAMRSEEHERRVKAARAERSRRATARRR